jgi:hypothetical protein
LKDVDLPVDQPTPNNSNNNNNNNNNNDNNKQPPKPPEKDPPEGGSPPDPPTFGGQKQESENNTIFYVIDISGSMGWDTAQYTAPDGSTKTGSRLDRAKAELVKSIASLPEDFKFNVIVYDCSFTPWQAEMQKADPPQKAAAIGWVMGKSAGGGTGTAAGTCAALGDRENKLVVLLTDGEPYCGATLEAHRGMIRAGNAQNAVINVFGIGATGRFKQFCMDVAADNGGTYSDVR